MITAAAIFATKVMFTGIMGFVPSKKDPKLIRVVVPNARVRRLGELAPAHVTYVMFDMDDLASTDPTVSRQPDFTITNDFRQLGVCLIKGENLDLGAFTSTTSAPDIDDGLPTEIFMCCRDRGDTKDVPIDNNLLMPTPDASRVSLRIDLAHGDLANETASIDPNVSNVVDSKKTCRPLTRLVSLTLPTTGPAELTIKSTPFAGTPQQPELKLKKTSSDPLIVMIGNEPVADISVTSDFLISPDAVHASESLNVHTHSPAHMAILNRLTENQEAVFTPALIPVCKCEQGVSTFVGSGATGKPDGCNPTGMPATDPSELAVRKRSPKG